MIKNEKQYKISKKKLLEVSEKVFALEEKASTSISQKMILASTKNFKVEIEQEIKAYEKIKATKKIQLKETSIEQLPKLITQYKIANHLSNKEFAKQLNLKEQQLQRYEATGFKTISFEKLIRFLQHINLDIKVKIA